jgi:ABC-2 type transport system permease protein
MLKTLDLYRRLISVQIRSQMQYPGPFVFDTVATAFSLALYFVSLALIFERFGTMGGWRLAEIAFL